MTKQMRRLFQRGYLPTVVAAGILLLGGCSQEEPLGPDDDGAPVAVSFTAGVNNSAGTLAKTNGTRSTEVYGSPESGPSAGQREITGTTSAGIPYADYVDADGFVTRAFYPGASIAAGGSNAHLASSGSGTTRTGTTTGNTPETRTTAGGDEWMSSDEVGIFMLTTGGGLTTAANVLADNRKYLATPLSEASQATFAPQGGTPIYYPQSGNVDFVAYYPYGAKGSGSTTAGEVNTDNYTYNISVADQSTAQKQAAADVLYAKANNGGSGYGKSSTAVNLTFSHALSKVTLNVKAGVGLTASDIENFAAANVTFGGMPVTAQLALQNGAVTTTAASTGITPLKSTGALPTGFQAVFSGILVPQPQNGNASGISNYADRTVTFDVPGFGKLTWTIPDTEVFAAGNHYTYPVTVNRTSVSVGAPAITKWTGTEGTPTPGTAEVLAVKIPKGTFKMGSSDGSNSSGSPADVNYDPNDPQAYSDEKPQHWVRLTDDFWMSKYQITNAQYAAFLNATDIESGGSGSVIYELNGNSTTTTETFISAHNWGVKYEAGNWIPQTGYENHPVINVTWFGAKAYADWIGGSLPTEAQWEYACRGGTTTIYSYGNTDDGEYMWYSNNSGGKTNEVGKKKPNPWGLYDMHGNVFEWCLDQWNGSDNYPTAVDEASAIVNPYVNSGPYRVLRGGYWNYLAQNCRSAYRLNAYPDIASDYFGFRVVVVP